MYQLQENTTRSNRPFLQHQIQEQGPTSQRTCTDIICLVLFLLFVGAFIGIIIYAFIAGNPRQALAIHNIDGQQCNKNSNFQFGYFVIPGSVTKAMCVSTCPKNNQTVNCLVDSGFCPGGTYTAPSNYSTFSIFEYCIPDPQVGASSLTVYFDQNLIISWIFDIQDGYLVVIGAAIAALILVIVYSCLLRCLTGCIIWTSVIVIEIVVVGVGILLILEASGVKLSDHVPINLARLSQTELNIAGSVLIVFGALFLLLVICMCSRLELGVKVVETASVFLSERFYMALMPIISTIFFFLTIAAVIAGGIFLYGTGNKTLTLPNAFNTIDFSTQLIVLYCVFGFAGFWMVVWIFYANTFVIMSAACIWYYQHDSPLCSSIHRLLRYHTGSVAFTSLLFGLLSIFRLIAKFFHLRNESSDNKCMNVLIQVGTFCLCIFDQFLKFLSEGVFVQIAMRSTNYCVSTLEAFKLITSNPVKITITGIISYMVAILGVLFIMAAVCVAAYFVQLQVTYFSSILTDPIPMTVISGIVVAIVAGVYLSVLADSAESIIQCYLIDETESRQKGMSAKFAPDHLKLLLEDHMT